MVDKMTPSATTSIDLGLLANSAMVDKMTPSATTSIDLGLLANSAMVDKMTPSATARINLYDVAQNAKLQRGTVAASLNIAVDKVSEKLELNNLKERLNRENVKIGEIEGLLKNKWIDEDTRGRLNKLIVPYENDAETFIDENKLLYKIDGVGDWVFLSPKKNDRSCLDILRTEEISTFNLCLNGNTHTIKDLTKFKKFFGTLGGLEYVGSYILNNGEFDTNITALANNKGCVVQCWGLKSGKAKVCRVFQTPPIKTELWTNVVIRAGKSRFFQNGTTGDVLHVDGRSIRTTEQYSMFPKELGINNDAQLRSKSKYIGLYTGYFRNKQT